MRVDHELDLWVGLVDLRVDAAFAGWFDVAGVAQVRYGHRNHLVLAEAEIVAAAGSDDEVLVIDSGADIAPRSGD